MSQLTQKIVQRKSAAGFSLIELMISILLGLIIISGAVSVYLGTKRSFNEADQVATLSENGRFALQLMSNSVRHINFFGGAFPADIRMGSSLDTSVADNCSGDASAYDTANSMFAVRATSASVLNCITDAVPNTDVLVIKGVEPDPLYDADPDDPNAPRDGQISFPAGAWSNQEVYVVANTEAGVIIDGADTKPDVLVGSEFALGVAWPYRLFIYYVRQEQSPGAGPTLSRKVLTWRPSASSMAVETQDLVQGVEDLRFLFGYDAAGSGNVNTMTNLDAVTTAGAWDEVTSVQVFVLVRSDVSDPNYQNEKTYQLGDLAVGPMNDNFRRVLLHSQVVMRNPRLLLRGGA
ncbi:MAG: PilW family protein [Pseudomonadota bacterium]